MRHEIGRGIDPGKLRSATRARRMTWLAIARGKRRSRLVHQDFLLLLRHREQLVDEAWRFVDRCIAKTNEPVGINFASARRCTKHTEIANEHDVRMPAIHT